MNTSIMVIINYEWVFIFSVVHGVLIFFNEQERKYINCISLKIANNLYSNNAI